VIYFDTSYLVRLYVEDPGWDAVRALAATDDVASAVHGRTETVAAFHRILRERHVDVLRFGELLNQFLDDCAASSLLICKKCGVDCFAMPRKMHA